MEDIKTIKEERQIILDELKNEKTSIRESIDELSSRINDMANNNEAVIEYLLLRAERNELLDKSSELSDDIETQEMLNCDHIFANDELHIDHYPTINGVSRYVDHGVPVSSDLRCIKCYISQKHVKSQGKLMLRRYQKPNIVIQSEYARKLNLRSFKPLSYPSFELGQAVYQRILDRNPDIDEETAKRYYESAIRNIMGKTIPEEKHRDRARRLQLKPYDRYKN